MTEIPETKRLTDEVNRMANSLFAEARRLKSERQAEEQKPTEAIESEETFAEIAREIREEWKPTNPDGGNIIYLWPGSIPS